MLCGDQVLQIFMPDLPLPLVPEGSSSEGRQTLSPRERAAVVARIRALMEYWQIAVEDLDLSAADDVHAAPPSQRPVKYRHPLSGETWDGCGPHPDWLREALLHQGYRVEELRPLAGPQSG